MWIDTDIAIPAFDKQIVKIKVADFAENYVTEGYYNHREQVWYDKNGHCLNDNVYKWLSDNQPDMREKVREYITELDTEYDRCIGQAESILAAIGDYDEKPMPLNYIKLVERAEVLREVKNNLKSRLEELV